MTSLKLPRHNPCLLPLLVLATSMERSLAPFQACQLLSRQPEPPYLQQAHIPQPLLVGPCHLGLLVPDQFPNTPLELGGSSTGNNTPGTAIDYIRALKSPPSFKLF